MTLEEAIDRLRQLEWSAREGWPMGQPPYLADRATACLFVIDQHVAAQPEGDRAATARRIRERIEARPAAAPRRPALE